MPNWCEGTMKVRGKRKNVENFLLNGLNKYLFNPKTKEYEKMPKEQAIEITENEYGKEIDIIDSVYIEGTYRAFVDESRVFFDAEESDDKEIIVVLPFRQAWSIHPEDFDKLKNECGVDFRLYGIDCGMGVEIEVIAVRGEETVCTGGNYGSYDDFLWECPFPHMGG